MVELKNIAITSPVQIKGNIQFKDQQITFLVGENGIGKSTLFYQLTTLDTLKCHYYVDGKHLKISEPALANFRRKNLGFTLQNDDLNSELPMDIYVRLFQLVCPVSLNDIQKNMALLNLKMSKQKVSTLSGGEKIRLSLALAFAKKCKLLILDEPTSALDEEHCLIVKKMILQKKKETSICIISHDSRIMDLADVMYTIRDGVIEYV